MLSYDIIIMPSLSIRVTKLPFKDYLLQFLGSIYFGWLASFELIYLCHFSRSWIKLSILIRWQFSIHLDIRWFLSSCLIAPAKCYNIPKLFQEVLITL